METSRPIPCGVRARDTQAIYVHELAHALAVAPCPALITGEADCLATTPLYRADRPAPSPVELLGFFLAGPLHDWNAKGDSDLDAFVAVLIDEAKRCQPREDAAKAIMAMQELSPEEIAIAFACADRAVQIARSVAQHNASGIEALAHAIETCSSGFGVLVAENELVDLVQGRSPMWRQIVDFD